MKRKNAFTLIELLAVIALISILIIIAIPNVIKIYKESKKNMFITQVRKTAKESQSKYIENIGNTFDCNNILSGQKYRECTGTISSDNVAITALGDGTFSNFLMVDVTSEPDSGIFVDLDELNLVEVDKEETFNEPLIENNEINSFYRSVTGKEFENKMKEFITDSSEEEYLQEMSDMIEKMRTNYKINNNKISQKNILESTSSATDSEIRENILIYEVNFTKNMIGNYKITNFNFEIGLFMTESDISKLYSSDSDININQYLIQNDYEFTVNENEKIYLFLLMIYGNEYDSFSIERAINTQSLQLIGENTIKININDVKKYTDEGIKNRGNKITKGKDFYGYTNLREKEGSYKYYYILKTNDGIKVLKRNLYVFTNTSPNCFNFKLNNSTKTYSIVEYYDNEKNDPYGKECPKDVYIPDKYNGANIEFIENDAFSSKNINSVKLPNYLKEIDSYSFYNNNLKTVLLPRTLDNMGWATFKSNNIQYIEYNGISKFCTNSIGKQKNGIGTKRYYNGKTSSDFLIECPE